MAFRFKTYTELGEAVKQARPELAERNSESVGLRFADRYGDRYNVLVDEESDRAPFAFDPEEGQTFSRRWATCHGAPDRLSVTSLRPSPAR